MDYRTNARPGPATLVVKNHSTIWTLVFGAVCGSFGLIGLLLLAAALLGGPGEARLLVGVMGGGFTLIGGLTTFLMAKLGRAQTTFSRDGETLRIALADGTVHELLAADFVVADIEASDDSEGTTYRTRIVIRGRDPIFLDDGKTSMRSHYARSAAAIGRFLDRG